MSERKGDDYADFLPAVYRHADAADAAFLRRYLEIFERVLARPEEEPAANPAVTAAQRQGLARVLDVLPDLFYPRLSFLFPDSADFIPPFTPAFSIDPNYKNEKLAELNSYFGIADPVADPDNWPATVEHWLSEFLDWQAQWVGFACDDGWSLDRKRKNLAEILPVFRQRGTVAGLNALLKILLGEGIKVYDAVEAPALVVGRTTELKSQFETGDAVVAGVRPFSFVVELWAPTYDFTTPAILEKIAALKALVDQEKPAHTSYTLALKTATATVGVYSRVGVDILLPRE
jgi:phage tail-like protein